MRVEELKKEAKVDFLSPYLVGLLAIVIYMTLLWGVSLWLKDASIVDIFWGLGFVMVTWLYAAYVPDVTARGLLLNVLVTIWGLRLSLHIGARNWGRGEDFRYRAWREEAGERVWWWQSYLRVFLLQGAVMWIVSAPLLGVHVLDSGAGWTIWDALAVVLWLVGFVFEAVGDWQLRVFKARPENHGKVMNRGLWRYTRHPNYFGDATLWWGLFLFTLGVGGAWTIFSPLLMSYLLVRVSGVRMLESTLKHTKPEYAAYVRSTSAFLPLPPKSTND